MFNKTAIVCAVALLMSTFVWADHERPKPPVISESVQTVLPVVSEQVIPEPPATVQPELPVIPEPLRDGQSIEPDINIIQQEDRTIQEYRMNGELYMVKVTPKVGLPYFLMDTDGDGSLETRQHELDSGLLVPNWILLEW